MKKLVLFLLCLQLVTADVFSQDDSKWATRKGKLIYSDLLSNGQDVANWKMEGPGEVKFADGWMEMYSPGGKWDHFFWCPKDFPESFIAECQMQNMDTTAGLTIIFFAAKGSKGEDIFDASLPKRDGTFKYYNKGQIDCYHISYYSNNPKNPERHDSHLRKDPMFALLQTGKEGIPGSSDAVHAIRLIKYRANIIMYVNDRKIIDYTDDGKTFGPVYTSGKIGFRQMRWTDFRYRDFKVWEVKDAN